MQLRQQSLTEQQAAGEPTGCPFPHLQVLLVRLLSVVPLLVRGAARGAQQAGLRAHRVDGLAAGVAVAGAVGAVVVLHGPQVCHLQARAW